MATLLSFHASAPIRAPVTESPAQRRVRIASRGLAALFLGLSVLAAVVLLAGIGAMLFYAGPGLRIGPDGCYIGGGPANSVAFGSLPLVHRLVYVLVALVRYAPVLMLFDQLHRLFRFYGRGQVFTPPAGLAFSRIGGWLCAIALSPLDCHLALSASGYEIDRVWLHIESVQAFILGLLVWVIGQVMQVGREIAEDREGFV
jgi:hypothetical protein